ncbi:UPF0120 protein [Tieghemostelium lacteum]|uniref:UPF0120 protein n=1 Tax=Tieghemostelium lacteum TaxID=361077 RepID=A0A152A4F5_TIELA|nr:UPF0120 protein [Tieghemostelium lacteum]|eukprot:KYR01120.1 UPF0120 protein [Tieghemostelium lacteum]
METNPLESIFIVKIVLQKILDGMSFYKDGSATDSDPLYDIYVFLKKYGVVCKKWRKVTLTLDFPKILLEQTIDYIRYQKFYEIGFTSLRAEVTKFEPLSPEEMEIALKVKLHENVQALESQTISLTDPTTGHIIPLYENAEEISFIENKGHHQMLLALYTMNNTNDNNNQGNPIKVHLPKLKTMTLDYQTDDIEVYPEFIDISAFKYVSDKVNLMSKSKLTSYQVIGDHWASNLTYLEINFLRCDLSELAKQLVKCHSLESLVIFCICLLSEDPNYVSQMYEALSKMKALKKFTISTMEFNIFTQYNSLAKLIYSTQSIEELSIEGTFSVEPKDNSRLVPFKLTPFLQNTSLKKLTIDNGYGSMSEIARLDIFKRCLNLKELVVSTFIEVVEDVHDPLQFINNEKLEVSVVWDFNTSPYVLFLDNLENMRRLNIVSFEIMYDARDSAVETKIAQLIRANIPSLKTIKLKCNGNLKKIYSQELIIAFRLNTILEVIDITCRSTKNCKDGPLSINQLLLSLLKRSQTRALTFTTPEFEENEIFADGVEIAKILENNNTIQFVNIVGTLPDPITKVIEMKFLGSFGKTFVYEDEDEEDEEDDDYEDEEEDDNEEEYDENEDEFSDVANR